MIASSSATAGLGGAIPIRADAGIAIESTDTITAAVITKIRLIINSSGSRSCGLLPQFPERAFVPLPVRFWFGPSFSLKLPIFPERVA